MRTSPAANIGLPASAPPDGVIRTSSPQAELGAQQQFLVGERRVQFGDLDAVDPGGTRGGDGGREVVRSRAPRCAESTACAMPVIQAGRLGELAGPVPGGEHDHRGAVGDRRAVVAAQRVGEVGLGEQFVDVLRAGQLRVAGSSRRRAAPAPPPRPSPARVHSPASMPSRACSPATAMASGHSGASTYGSSCSGERAGQVARRRLAEPVDERGVHLAGLDLDPRLVQRPRRVGLDVRLVDRRHRADRVDRGDERERPAGEVVRGARAPEADVALRAARARRAPRRRSAPASRRRWWCRRVRRTCGDWAKPTTATSLIGVP